MTLNQNYPDEGMFISGSVLNQQNEILNGLGSINVASGNDAITKIGGIKITQPTVGEKPVQLKIKEIFNEDGEFNQYYCDLMWFDPQNDSWEEYGLPTESQKLLVTLDDSVSYEVDDLTMAIWDEQVNAYIPASGKGGSDFAIVRLQAANTDSGSSTTDVGFTYRAFDLFSGDPLADGNVIPMNSNVTRHSKLKCQAATIGIVATFGAQLQIVMPFEHLSGVKCQDGSLGTDVDGEITGPIT